MRQYTLDEFTSIACPTCDRLFDSERGMKIHHKRAHGESIAGIERTCDACGETFRRSASVAAANEKDFCSHECHGSYLERRVEVACTRCGTVFNQRPSRAESQDRHFCSSECESAWRSEYFSGESSPMWRGRITKQCAHCGDEFEVRPSDDDHRFCSRDCFHTHMRETGRLAGENNPAWVPSTELECTQCGETYEVPPCRAEDSKFCSAECLGEWKAEITGQDHPLWRGGADWYRAIRSSLGPTGWQTQRETYLEDACELCGDSACTLALHHIIPVLSGGTNGEYNYKTFCRSCHSTVEEYTRSIPEITALLTE